MDKKGCHIVNIANETEWCIIDVANQIKEITNSSSNITFIDAPSKRYDYEVERRVGSSKKLVSLTKYKPDTTLNDGLNKIFKRNHS
jgi:nucleoside-diphosphate-sugar epimerase